MKKVWVLEKRTEGDLWDTEIVSNNYFKFCGEVIKFLGEKDFQASEELKKSLGPSNGLYSDSVKDQYKKVHDEVFGSYRVVEGQVPEDSKDFSDYEVVKVNEGVYKYLWYNKKSPSQLKNKKGDNNK